MSSFEISSVAPVEFKKFKPLEIYSDTSEQEILHEVDKYLADLGSLVPPVRGVLDIETLKETIRARKDEKEVIFRDFKEQLNNKRLGMACCRMLIEGLIDQNPEISYFTILEIINRFENIYVVSNTEYEEMIKSLELFEENRVATYQLRTQYPNDADLFNNICGIPIRNTQEIVIFTTPYGFLIHLPRKIFRKIPAIAEYGSATGLSVLNKNQTGHHYRVAFVVTDYLSSREVDRISKHEVIHAKTKFFHDLLPENVEDDLIKLDNSQNKRINITQSRGLGSYTTDLLEQWEEVLRKTYRESNTIFLDELISSKDYLEINRTDFFIRYYSLFNKDLFQSYKKLFLEYQKRALVLEGKQNIENMEIYWRNKSEETLKKAYYAFLRLSREKGLSRDEAVAFLSYLPLEMWEKTVNRLDAKKARKRISILSRLFRR